MAPRCGRGARALNLRTWTRVKWYVRFAPALAAMALVPALLSGAAAAPGPVTVAMPSRDGALPSRDLAGNVLDAEPAYAGPFVDYQAFSGHGDLAFVSLGGLYVLDGTQHKLVQLVPLAGGASDPQFSPNGEWLTYSVGDCAACFYLAHADGSGAHPEPLPANGNGRVAWLPDSRLLVGDGIDRVSATGGLAVAGQVPSDLVAWSAGWDEFAFETADVRTAKDGAFSGKWVLELASSLTGERTVWYQSPISFVPASGRGFQGNQFAGAQLLPGHEGPSCRSTRGTRPTTPVASVSTGWLPPGGQPYSFGRSRQVTSVSRQGVLAVGAGGNEYAWTDKYVEICKPSPVRCSTVEVPPGQLSFDPAWSPQGTTLALVEAKAETAGDFLQSTVLGWYSTHHLFLLAAASSRPAEVPATQGAAAPTWSADGKSILYVAGNYLWLLRHIGSRPVKVAGPVLAPSDWGAFFGEVNWQSDFAWSEA